MAKVMYLTYEVGKKSIHGKESAVIVNDCIFELSRHSPDA
jgi:hypothetical protein